MTPSTPKTYLHLAREAPGGVVIYRRSHLTTYLLRLTAKDSLVKGSRFYGRLFPERCDLSPDGRLFAYFAMRGKKTDGKSDPATWSAVCTPPWLKAHVFMPNGTTWGGGGVFLPGRLLFLLDHDAARHATEAIRPYRLVAPRELSPEQADYVRTMTRPAAVAEIRSPLDGGKGRLPMLMRRTRKVASGYDKFDYTLVHPDGSDVAGAEEIVLADWAGWDSSGRLLSAAGRQIKIFRVKPGKPLYKPERILDIEDALSA